MDDKGLNPVLKFGMRKSNAGFDAHSWVEYQGEILNDSQFVKAEFAAFEMNAKSDVREVTSGSIRKQ